MVEDRTWTFEHEFLKKLLISYVYLKEMPLAGHLCKSTSNSEAKTLKNLKKSYFSNQKATKTVHIKKKNTDLLH